MHRSNLRRAAAASLSLALVAACTDQPLAPVLPPESVPAGMAQLECRVDAAAGTFACADVASPGGASLNRIIGGQERYVRLAGGASAYDGGTDLFTVSVTVENLLAQPMGTDGVTQTGVYVFFPEPVTNGVQVIPDGTGMFLGAGEPYYHYAQVLQPYEVSAPRTWTFDMNGQTAFSFRVYVSADLPDEAGDLLDAVWNGSAGSAWADSANWVGGVVPDSASTVAIPVDSLLSGADPVLSADVQLTHLRVGAGSTLDLDGYLLTAWGNVDATGEILNGTVRIGGTSVVINGVLPSLRVTGSAQLQGALRTTGPVSIADGSLNVANRTLTIQIP